MGRRRKDRGHSQAQRRLIHFACLKCHRVEKVSEFVPELIHSHEGDLYRMLAFQSPEQAERYASVTSDNWKPVPEGLAKFITADGAEKIQVIRMPPTPYVDFAMMPSISMDLMLEGNANMTEMVKRRRFEYRGREDDGTLLFREKL